MKRFLFSVILAMGSITSFAYDFEVDGIYYAITSEANLTVEVTYKSMITGNNTYHGCLYYGSITIPESVVFNGKNYTVTGIGAWAFGSENNTAVASYMQRLTSIELPSTIEYIGDNAFCCCDALSSLIIPSSVKDIYGYSTLYCRNCKLFIFLPPTPPKLHGSNPSRTYALYIPGEIVVPKISLYKADSNWNHEKDGNRWGGFVEMLTPTSYEFDYNGQMPVVTWINNLSTYTMNVSGVLEKNAGNYSTKIKADFFQGSNLAFSVEYPFEYTIKKVKLNSIANNVSRLYGDDNPSFKITYSGFVNGEDESVIITKPYISTTATKTSNVGEYAITPRGGSAKNYDFAYESGTLTITKAPLSVKVKDATKLYGSANPAFTFNYYGLKNGESSPSWTTSPVFITDANKNSGVGVYEIKAVDGILRNYEIEEIGEGTLSVTPAPLTIKANDVVKQYYNDNPTLSYTCKGFVNGEDESVLTNKPILSTQATQTSKVGTYEISLGETSSPNYNILYVKGILNITPRLLTVSVGDYERTYNEENPEFTVNYNGFVGNDDEKILTKKPSASTEATKTTDVGTYQITISGGVADNYKFSYNAGTLTINKAEQYITWIQNLSNLHVGDQVKMKAESSSGLPITYQILNSNIAEVYSTGKDDYLDCVEEGDVQIVAIQEGNKNYYTSPRSRKNIVISNTAGNLRGDLNGDGTVSMPDAMFIVNKILNGKFPDEK